MSPFDVIRKVVDKMSPELRAAVVQALNAVQADASKTPGPVDDIAIMIFRMLTGL